MTRPSLSTPRTSMALFIVANVLLVLLTAAFAVRGPDVSSTDAPTSPPAPGAAVGWVDAPQTGPVPPTDLDAGATSRRPPSP